ncbi:MAG: DUF465 domain-containing protein [Rickettsiales bacterium]|nr:DUF465 domain-containing protein [Rickettsiales bacterium]
MGEEEKYLKELEELKKEHTDLDNKINLWYKNTALKDELQLQRMKKRKLWLRDRINWLENFLYPDIIA